jgi:DNA-binding winged helix-turn-helix (wHTH) protein/ATP/maltotriose-dependent transcriptional regulator MalT
MNNPFVYHVPIEPANFVGRERILGLIFDQLRSPSRANIAIYGPLGSGKSSLLNYISDPEIAAQHGLDPKKYLLGKIDCQSLGVFTPDRFWRRLLRNISRMTAGKLQQSVDSLLAQAQISFEDFQDLLDEIERVDRVLIAMLDEFECVVRTHTEIAEQITGHFLGMLSSLGRRTPRVFTMVIATEQPLTMLGSNLDIWRGSPFPTIFISQELSVFSQSEADELIDRALAGTGIPFSHEERRLLYEETDRHPAHLQAGAAALFEAKQRSVTDDELKDTLRQAVADSRANSSHNNPAVKGIQLDHATGAVWVDGRRIEELSNKEFNLLRFLHGNAGRVCLKEEVWKAVWPEYEEGMEDYPIQKLISRLRHKIEPMPSRPQYIVTVWGRGYKFVDIDTRY